MKDHPKGHVNSSGFPLQIGIKNLVNSGTSRHGWRTVFTEYAWRNGNEQDSGFIDLVLKNIPNTVMLIVECKRVKDCDWIFLIEAQHANNTRRHAKSFVFTARGPDIKRFEWLDLTVAPYTPESEFCVIPGSSGDSRKTLIERTAAELVSSCEAFALEEKRLMLKDRDTFKVYFNVIVTTATLKTCTFSAKEISIKTGEIENALFEEVPFIRFRKQINPHYELPEIYAVAGDFDTASAKESTVFIVNSNHFDEFLSAFEIDDGMTNKNYLSMD